MWGGKGSEWGAKEEGGVREGEEVEGGRKERKEEEGRRREGERGLIRSIGTRATRGFRLIKHHCCKDDHIYIPPSSSLTS